MQYKIYINNKPLYLCNELDDTLSQLLHRPDNIFIDELDTHTIKSMLKELRLPEIKSGIFYHNDIETLKKAFFKKFEIIKAAGGCVTNEEGDVLLIFRRGFWDMPKGKIDEGESIEECAVREVREETGLQHIQLQHLLTITYHTYEQGTHHILKESHWFAMQAKGHERLIPQIEEDIAELKWVAKNDLPDYETRAYPSIVDVLNRAAQAFKGKKNG